MVDVRTSVTQSLWLAMLLGEDRRRLILALEITASALSYSTSLGEDRRRSILALEITALSYSTSLGED